MLDTPDSGATTGGEGADPTRLLRGGVVGFGRMGLTHYAILNTHPLVRFAGVCDDSKFMRKNVNKHLGVEAFGDFREMIDKAALDFLIVATPTRSHAEVVQYALERGLHVFVEKPFVLDATHGTRLVELAESREVVNQVGYVVRFNDVMMQVHKLIAEGALGELIHFKMEMYGPTVLREAKSWRASRQEGGGCLYDFASHSIDLTNHLFGVPDGVTGTVAQSIYSRNVEDAMYTTLLYPGALRGSLLVNWSDPSYRKPTYGLEVLGREGKIVADLHAYKLFFRGEPPVAGFEQGWNTRYVTDFVEPVRVYVRGYEFTRQLDYFIDCIQQRRPASKCSFASGLATDRIIAQIAADADRRAVANG